MKTHPIQCEFYDFYRTARGAFTPKGELPELTTKSMLSSPPKFMNFYPFNDIEIISPRPMLFIAGEKAHSIEFSEDAYKRAAEPKELLIVPGAGHVDLYDRVNFIPWKKISSFFSKNLPSADKKNDRTQTKTLTAAAAGLISLLRRFPDSTGAPTFFAEIW
ncbi:hypothetical protein MASR1M12_22050 [Erysipelotrichia bacterium]